MMIDDLVAKLTQMREASTRGIDMTATMHLFGIIFDNARSRPAAPRPPRSHGEHASKAR